MSAQVVHHQNSPGTGPTPDRDGRRAWIAVGLIPVAFAVAMVGGEGLVSALGYGGDAVPPWWVVGAVGVPMTLFAVGPGVAALVYGRRAFVHGYRYGAVAAWIGGLAAAYLLLASLAGVVQRLL
jgi:MFS family permease